MSDLNKVEKLSPFGRFCRTIGNLPSSYMESLTFEEQTMWFCDFLQNKVIPTVNENAECVEELQNLYVELKNYVDNYFDNLDVQEEINIKLQIMASDGTLENIFKPYFAQKVEEINTLISEQNNKMNEINNRINNIVSTPHDATEGNIELLDGRLSKNGVTFTNIGNNIRNQAENMSNNLKNQSYILKDLFFINRILSNDNTTIDYTSIRNNRLINENIMYFKESDEVIFTILDPENYNFDIYQYNVDGSYISHTGWRSAETKFTTGVREKGFRIALKKNDNSNITNDDLVNLQITITPSHFFKVSSLNFTEKMKSNAIFEFNTDIMVRSGIINANGTIGNHAHRYYTPHFYYFEKGTVLKANDGFRIGCHFYPDFESELNHGQNQLVTDACQNLTLENDGYYRFMIFETPYDDVTTLETICKNVEIRGKDYIDSLAINNKINDAVSELDFEGIEERYKEEIETVAYKVTNIQNKNTFSFPFITDLHLDIYTDTNNKGKNNKLMFNNLCKSVRELVAKANLEFVALGGDNTDNHWVSTSGNSLYRQKLNTNFTKSELLKNSVVPLLIANGNHDDNSIRDCTADNQVRTPSKTIFDYELYNYYQKFLENTNVVFGDKGKMYFYMDLPTQKVRVFVLNSIDIPYDLDENGHLKYAGQWTYAYRNEQLNFVANSLKFEDKENPQEWSALFIHHITVDTSLHADTTPINNNALVGIMNAYQDGTSYISSNDNNEFSYNVNVDFNGVQGTIIADIAGHKHNDFLTTFNNIPCIVTTTASYTDREENLPTAFDIFTIDTKQKKIIANRFGFGEDREIDY